MWFVYPYTYVYACKLITKPFIKNVYNKFFHFFQNNFKKIVDDTDFVVLYTM